MTIDPTPCDVHELQALTTKHYDAHPFDFLTPEDEASIATLQPRAFRVFVEAHAWQGETVVEIGSGPGRGTMFMLDHGLDVVAVDLSQRSLELARARAPSAHFVRATNLDLPFPDGRFTLVVSDGVIHHTPDPRRAFAENARILAGGGAFYLGVYNPRRYYRFLYQVVGAPVRRMEKTRAGRVLIHATLFPIYYLAHLVKSRGRRTLRGAHNLFYDYLLTPRASFHGRNEITAWGRDEGLELIKYDSGTGNVHVFIFRKRTSESQIK